VSVLQTLTRGIARATTLTTPGQDGRSAWSKSELLARLRGEQTIRRMRAQGLNAPDPFYIASRVSIDPGFAWAVQIGAHATISANVQIIAHDSAMVHLTGYTLVRPVKIGVKCYIGAGTTILPGTVIGDGAIVGAGSVVSGEIPADTIVAGNPARVRGHTDEYRARHLAALAEIPRFERGPAEPGGLGPSELDAMKRALVTHGRFYVR
jgi:UDP-3-O-[3-hydroxymyristoyl] glucosamine N-acyltransferase